MRPDCIVHLVIPHLLLFISLHVQRSIGGVCWSSMSRGGRCTSELLGEHLTREECCATAGHVGGTPAAAWSADDLDPGTLFFWRVLGGGVPCQPCRESCSGVKCPRGRKCALRHGRPRCVCAPDCSNKKKGPGQARHAQGSGGPVCGTDGRTYRSVCRLKKRACRRNSSTLHVAYHGACQATCDRVRCPHGKSCLVDQNLTPHCVRCARRCSKQRNSTSGEQRVCGSDGRTYQSACHLREAACRKGRAIPVAYRGKCIEGATCSTVRCRERQSCLTTLGKHPSPRCVTCGGKCPSRTRGVPNVASLSSQPLCGTNNHTYHSWCHMLRDACVSGYVIETKYPGACHATNIKKLIP